MKLPLFRKYVVLLGFLLSLCLPITALAWGKTAHHVVANVALTQLTPRAKAEVDRLLALEPGETFQSISMWADEHRNPATGAWHYINFPRDSCTYDAQRDCPDGKCVVGAINHQLSVLASNASDQDRFKALKYVVHFVADVHQPMHAGYADDRGGNQYQFQAMGRGTNLHAFWDSGLISAANGDVQTLTQRSLAKGKPAQSTDLDVMHAAQESCQIVASQGFYPGRQLENAYVNRFLPVLEQRLSLAGFRLAGLLNRVLK